jgi:hypothetical protein
VSIQIYLQAARCRPRLVSAALADDVWPSQNVGEVAGPENSAMEVCSGRALAASRDSRPVDVTPTPWTSEHTSTTVYSLYDTMCEFQLYNGNTKVTLYKVEHLAAQSATRDVTQPIRAQRGKQWTNQCADTRYP